MYFSTHLCTFNQIYISHCQLKKTVCCLSHGRSDAYHKHTTTCQWWWNFICHLQVEVADLLTPTQLAQLSATPSQLKSIQDVTKIMTVINSDDFSTFFDTVSPAIKVNTWLTHSCLLNIANSIILLYHAYLLKIVFVWQITNSSFI